jgi:phage major head subunit gpT-like protein
MGSPYHLVSGDCAQSLTELQTEFLGALAQGDVDQWAEQAGHVITSNALKDILPVAVYAALYREFQGDIKYRSLFEKSIELTPKTWQDGVSELASVVEAPDFTGWSDQPDAMAKAALSIANDAVMALLEAGVSTACQFDGQFFFDTDHPVNLFKGTDTFSNDFTGAGTDFTLANVQLAKQRFRDIAAPNGRSAGLEMTHVGIPNALVETYKDLFEADMLIQSLDGGTTFGAVPNRHKGTVKAIILYEATDDAAWYPLALNKSMRPWIIKKGPAPTSTILDKSSHLYQTQLKVGMFSIASCNAALAIPHCAQRFAGTAP